MKRAIFAVLAIVVIHLSTIPSAMADGLIQTIPAEKSWVQYRMSEAWENGIRREIDISIRMLKRTEYEGKDVAFVEMEFSVPDDPLTKRAYLFMVPKGRTPDHEFLDNPGVVWSKSDGTYSRKDDSWDGFLPRLQLIFADAAPDDSTTAPLEKVIEVDGKSLKCKSSCGDSAYSTRIEDVKINYEVSRCADVPFGVAKLKLKMDHKHADEPERTSGGIEITLTAFGLEEMKAKQN